MVRKRRQWHLAVAVAALSAVGLVSCGGGNGGTEPAAEQPRGVATPGSGGGDETSAIPEVNVLDVRSGADFALGSIVPSERPVLVWFWAPH